MPGLVNASEHVACPGGGCHQRDSCSQRGYRVIDASNVKAAPIILLEGRCPHHQGGRFANSRPCSSPILHEKSFGFRSWPAAGAHPAFSTPEMRGRLQAANHTSHVPPGLLKFGGVIFFGLFFFLGPCFSSFLGTGGMDMGLGLRPRARGADPRAGAGIPTRIYTSVHPQLLPGKHTYITGIHIYKYIPVYKFSSIPIYPYTYIHIYIYTYIHIYIYTYINISVYMFIYICIYMYISLYVYM